MSWTVYKGKSESQIEMGRPDEMDAIHVAGLNFYLSKKSRFEKDKLFYDYDQFLIVLDGVLLNKLELYAEYKVNTMNDLFLHLYEEYKTLLVQRLRGPFSGVIFEKTQNKLTAFCNQTGDTHIFYFYNKEHFILSTNFNDIVKYLKNNRIEYHFGEQAVKYMLTYGYLIDENTFITEVYRLRPGRLLVFYGNSIMEEIYHRFSNIRCLDITIDQAIELLDEGFKEAVKRCFDKDLEYGYTHHLADMSGGLDSRMVNWVARSLGYTNITNLSYSQSGTNEQKFACKASNALKNKLIFKQLDDISFLYEIEEILLKNYGMASYPGITGGNQLLGSINMNLFGLEHTGQLGDVVIGSYVSELYHTLPDEKSYRMSDKLSFEVKDLKNFPNQELYIFYTRGMEAILSTHSIRRDYTIAVSPFIDVDFLELCFSIPLEYRVNHRLYYAWVKKKYPEALKIKSTTLKSETKAERALIFLKLAYHRLKYESNVRLYNLRIKKEFKAPYNNMNPFKYWYATNPDLRLFIDHYYNNSIQLIEGDSKIRQDIVTVFENGNISEKFAALTVLGMYKLHFSNTFQDDNSLFPRIGGK